MRDFIGFREQQVFHRRVLSWLEATWRAKSNKPLSPGLASFAQELFHLCQGSEADFSSNMQPVHRGNDLRQVEPEGELDLIKIHKRLKCSLLQTTSISECQHQEERQQLLNVHYCKVSGFGLWVFVQFEIEGKNIRSRHLLDFLFQHGEVKAFFWFPGLWEPGGFQDQKLGLRIRKSG